MEGTAAPGKWFGASPWCNTGSSASVTGFVWMATYRKAVIW